LDSNGPPSTKMLNTGEACTRKKVEKLKVPKLEEGRDFVLSLEKQFHKPKDLREKLEGRLWTNSGRETANSEMACKKRKGFQAGRELKEAPTGKKNLSQRS